MHFLGSVNKGGAESLFVDLLNFVNHQEEEHFLFSFYEKGDFENYLKKQNKVIKIDPDQKFSLVRELRRNFKTQKITIVHCHSPFHIFYSRIAGFGLPMKFVFTVHGFDETLRSKLFLKIAFSVSDKILFVSEAFKERLKKSIKLNGSSKSKILYNGIQTQKILNRERKDVKRHQVKIGMVGNFHNDVRDHLTVCRAANVLKKKKRQFTLQFAGGASKKDSYFLDQCKSFVKENELEREVKFLGFQDDINSLLQNWDLFVYSSNRDTFGIAVVEAMMSGIPVIVNDLDVFREITENGKYATLYKSKDPVELAGIIEDFINNPDPFLKNAKEARNFARKTYSIEAHYQRLTSIYKELVKN